MEDITFINKDRRGFLYQPNLTRWRHRYRGPRESVKINQELGQTYFDLVNLRNKYDILQAKITESIGLIDEGGAVGDIEYNVHDDATPSSEAFILEGLDDIEARIESLNRRLTSLEG